MVRMYDCELIMSWFKNKLGFFVKKNEILWPQLRVYILTLEVLTHDNLQTHVSLGKLLFTQGEKNINRWVEKKPFVGLIAKLLINLLFLVKFMNVTRFPPRLALLSLTEVN